MHDAGLAAVGQGGLRSLGRREGLLLVVFAALAVLAWLGTLDRMDGMVMSSRFDGGGLGFFVILWVVMMAAMMFPSMWPVLAIHARVVQWRVQRGIAIPGGSAAFTTGYLVAWTLYGLAAYMLLVLARAAGLDALSDTSLNRYVVGPIALLAAVYQVMPLKQVCLRHCRNPLFFLMDHWRSGILGSARVGLRHGIYCVGCCWALMLLLLGLGFMSVTWMAAGAGAIALEKLTPRSYGRAATILLAGAFLVLGVVAVASPDALPGTATMTSTDSSSPMGSTVRVVVHNAPGWQQTQASEQPRMTTAAPAPPAAHLGRGT